MRVCVVSVASMKGAIKTLQLRNEFKVLEDGGQRRRSRQRVRWKKRRKKKTGMFVNAVYVY